MRELIEVMKEFGAFSLDNIWFPLLVWTICCAIAFLFLRLKKNLNPLFHYHLRTAAILSLPLGIAASFLLQWIPQWLSASPVETAFFIIQNPIEVVAGGSSSAVEQSLAWQDPSFFIGLFTLILVAGSIVMAFRFVNSYRELNALYKKLEFSTASVDQQILIANQKVEIAFHDHPLVPFTFGWKKPVIVLPKILKKDSEKLNMALQHELIHIQRGDYLLQLALSIIQSIFWFHPLIHYGNQKIDTYREISCDQEVLSKTDFSIKSYASLLYELVPLNSGVGRLSVSMAVHNSTLKQRIKTMKYHKLHRTSFKQSIFFLLLMVIGITLPIACSDLRGTESLSLEELENSKLELQNVEAFVNDIELNSTFNGSVSTTGLGALLINAKEYGIFKIAPRRFEGGIQAGKIEGNSISFKINELNVEIRSSSQIISNFDESSIWIEHISVDTKSFSIYALRDANQATPPPPPTPSLGESDSLEAPNLPPKPPFPEEDQSDYFVVVEEMPSPIGGIQAIQSKVVYPDMARRAGIEGRVTVQFIVNEEGDVEKAKVIRGIGGGADEEALRVLNEAKFEPGIQRGRPVRVQFYLSIDFRLSDIE
ncbi:MAG: M56 family metallopeptidase [Balneolaceae bacterium]